MIVLVWLLAQAPLPSQGPPDLGTLAEITRTAFVRRDFSRLLGDRPSVRLELPDGNPSAAVTGRVAAASLGALFRRTNERGLELVGAALADDQHGYIELRRRYSVARTQDALAQRVLISARLEDGAWRVVEVWVSAVR